MLKKYLKKPPRFLLISLLTGFIVSTCVWLLFYDQVSIGKRGVAIWLAMFMLASFITLILNHRIADNQRLFRYPWILVVLAPLAGWLIISFWEFAPPKPLFLLPDQTITFNVSNEKNPFSYGNIIEINGVKNGGDWENLRNLNLSEPFEVTGESLYLLPSSSPMVWKIKAVDEVVLNFKSGPDSGIVEITSGQDRFKLDLYSEEVGEIPVTLSFPPPVFPELFSLLLYSAGFGYLGFILPSFLLVPLLHPQDSPIQTTLIQKDDHQTYERQIKKKRHHLYRILITPILTLALYCGIIAFIDFQFFSTGITYHFVIKLMLYGSAIIASRYLFIIEFNQIEENKGRLSTSSSAKIDTSSLLLLLLPLTPVVQYIISNRNSLTLMDSFFVLTFFILFSVFLVFVIPKLFEKRCSSRILKVFGLAFTFTVINMATLSKSFAWFETGDFRIQFIYFLFVLMVVWVLDRKVDKKVQYLLVGLFFVTNSGFAFLTQGDDEPRSTQKYDVGNLRSLVVQKEPVTTPNIYLLVYDAYVASETMEVYGIDNHPQEDYLTSHGFTIYPHTYSIGAATLQTMDGVLNISPDSTTYSERSGVSGNGEVQNALKSLGYTTYGIFPSDYMFRGVGASYDFFFPLQSMPQYFYLIMSIMTGEFRFDLDFESQTHDQYLTAKNEALNLNSGQESPVFVYSHSNVPNHSQNSGACLPDEVELFKERLDEANLEMQQDINTIFDNDPQAIIVVAGDHGPYLTQNCTSMGGSYDISEISRLDIQDRFGTFLAVRWPDEKDFIVDRITVIQDLFPAIFSYMFEDESFLEIKISPVITTYSGIISGASVDHGIIRGGVHDGEPLFEVDE